MISFYTSVPKSWSYLILVHDRCNCYFSFWAIFCPFTPLPSNSPKNENFKKWKKLLDISSLYICVPKLRSAAEIWHMTHVIIFNFGLFFALLPSNSPKNQNFKKWEKSLKISSFYIRALEIMIRWCTVSEIWCVTDVIVIFHFVLLFNSPKNHNGKEMGKMSGNIIILHTCTKNYDQMKYSSDGPDRWIDGWIEKVT